MSLVLSRLFNINFGSYKIQIIFCSGISTVNSQTNIYNITEFYYINTVLYGTRYTYLLYILGDLKSIL